MRLDGFVSADADHTGGWLRTLPGFALADCEEVGGNFIDQAVHSKGSPDVSALAGRPVRVHVTLTRAKLYAFRFTRD